MKSVKVLLETWRRYEKSLNESRLFTMSASMLKDIEFNRTMAPQHLDKTNLSDEEVIRDVLECITNNDDVSVSFVWKYKDDSGDYVIPSLGVSPKIKYKTPHGIYSYPLNERNIVNFLYTGKPTKADFATDSDYFHLIKSNSMNTIEIDADKSTNYTNSKYIGDCRELVRVFLYYTLSWITENDLLNKDMSNVFREKYNLNALKVKSSLDEVQFSYSVQENARILFYYIYKYFKNKYKESSNIDDAFINKVASYLDRLSLTRNNKFYEISSKERFYSLYYVAHFCSSFFTKIMIPEYSVYPTKRGGLFTVFLSSVGVTNIKDFKGTSLIHQNEPSQAVYTNISNTDNLILLGTYLNRRFDHDLVDKVLSEYYEKGLLSTAAPKGFSVSKSHIRRELNNSKEFEFFEYDLENYYQSLNEKLEQFTNGYEDYLSQSIEEILDNITTSLFSFISNFLKDTYFETSSKEFIEGIRLFIEEDMLSYLRKSVSEKFDYYLNYFFIDDDYIKSDIENSKKLIPLYFSKENFQDNKMYIEFLTSLTNINV